MQLGTHWKRSLISSFTALLTFLAATASVVVLGAWLGAGGPPALAQDAAVPPDGWSLSGDAERGRPTFNQYCAPCHGPEGKGDGAMGKLLETRPKDLTDREYMDTRSDYQLYVAIKKGGAAVGLSDKMAPWEPLLAEQDIQDLTLLVRELSRGE